MERKRSDQLDALPHAATRPEMPRLPPLQILTSKAKEEAIQGMQALLERRTGRPHTHEEARQAFENLFGFYSLISEWKAKADVEDPGWQYRPRRETPKQRTFTKRKKSKGSQVHPSDQPPRSLPQTDDSVVASPHATTQFTSSAEES